MAPPMPMHRDGRCSHLIPVKLDGRCSLVRPGATTLLHFAGSIGVSALGLPRVKSCPTGCSSLFFLNFKNVGALSKCLNFDPGFWNLTDAITHIIAMKDSLLQFEPGINLMPYKALHHQGFLRSAQTPVRWRLGRSPGLLKNFELQV